ncbi:type II toxin-antitoxin system PemK/MazF family toxin [Arthrobacter zhaoxinii]|uniref:type II toxin-antitoxin system PemK/MazF family toxin n=1 Tax=Arthrobacter zhaoxinii TaxID=2964616 RepID=UPI002107FAA5|nr:type II toxin-antitoxin system PemK/MazF family toxin [Arthrobacter zhaoxinii]MCQ2000712.1 type II toxin-antitoxin system PemK/MazF family toxin [Arthrobacter zhaoxinii]
MPFNARAFASLARSALSLLRQVSSSAGPAEDSRERRNRPRTQAPGRTPSPSPRTPAAPPRTPTAPPRTPAARPSPTSTARTAPSSSSPAGTGYAGDYFGPVTPVYAPQPDGDPDPGEVVWAWVPYEDDAGQGKDRPVLLIGRSGGLLLGLMMTSRDRNNRSGSDPRYLDVGTGPWDSKGRPSEVKLDRVLQLEPGSVRREGAIMDKNVFQTVARRLAVMRSAR